MKRFTFGIAVVVSCLPITGCLHPPESHTPEPPKIEMADEYAKDTVWKLAFEPNTGSTKGGGDLGDKIYKTCDGTTLVYLHTSFADRGGVEVIPNSPECE